MINFFPYSPSPPLSPLVFSISKTSFTSLSQKLADQIRAIHCGLVIAIHEEEDVGALSAQLKVRPGRV